AWAFALPAKLWVAALAPYMFGKVAASQLPSCVAVSPPSSAFGEKGVRPPKSKGSDPFFSERSERLDEVLTVVAVPQANLRRLPTAQSAVTQPLSDSFSFLSSSLFPTALGLDL